MRADAMLGRFNAAGGKHKLISRTSELAEVELTKDGETQRFALSWVDAQKEPFTRGKDGGIKDNYATPLKRKQMLWARVVSDGVRAMDPGIVCGADTPEELDDESTVPAGVIDGEFTVQKDPAPAAQSPEPAKRSRKPKDESPAAATASTPAPAAAPVATEAKPEPKPVETAAESVAAAVASVDNPAEVAAEPAATAPTVASFPVEIQQEIRDILDLKEYVGPRWPTTKGTWEATWEKVATALSIPAGETDVERFTKMSKDARTKLNKWLNDQRVNVDKLNQAKDLTAFGNQNPAAK